MSDLSDFVQAVVVAAAGLPLARLQHCLDVANCLVHEGGCGGDVAAAAVLALADLDEADAPFSDGVAAIVHDYAGARAWPEAQAIQLADALVRVWRWGPHAHARLLASDTQYTWVDGACARLHARLVEALNKAKHE